MRIDNRRVPIGDDEPRNETGRDRARYGKDHHVCAVESDRTRLEDDDARTRVPPRCHYVDSFFGASRARIECDDMLGCVSTMSVDCMYASNAHQSGP